MTPGPDVRFRRAAPADSRPIAEIHVRTWQKAYRRIIPDEFLDALWVDERAAEWEQWLQAGTADVWLAEIEGRPCGFASAGESRDKGSRDSRSDCRTGELYALYISAECWRNGIGRGLCQRAFGSLIERGFQQAVAWVLAENTGARRFYERLGMQADGAEKTEQFGGRELCEVRYRKSLHPLRHDSQTKAS